MSISLSRFLGGKKKDGGGGFTLVELLVVIAIISVLATLLLLQLGVARAKARDAKRIADVNQVRSALEQYFDQNGKYMETNVMTALVTSGFLLRVPVDPLSLGCAVDTYDGGNHGAADCYGYAFDPATNPTKYQIWAQLEQPNANALRSSSHIDSSSWSGAHVNANTAGNNGTAIPASCAAASYDCVFDLGQK